MFTQCYFKLNFIRTLLICSKMAYSCCFCLGGNLDFLQNSVITLTTDLSAFGAGVTVRENHRTLTVEGINYYCWIIPMHLFSHQFQWFRFSSFNTNKQAMYFIVWICPIQSNWRPANVMTLSLTKKGCVLYYV